MSNDLSLAKKLIRESLATQNPYLDLGNCGITDLTALPELFECLHLETLILCTAWTENNKAVFSKNNRNNRNNKNNNDITSLPDSIVNLKKLKCFRCGFRSGELLNADLIKKLTTLQVLDLSYNQISDYSFLEKLTTLQTLDLSNNQISDISFLEKLTTLQVLDLSYNQISDYSFLEKLTTLQTLYLSHNQISDISFLEKLTTLQSLDLRNNQISDISFLEKLTTLQALYLSNNQISDISFLEKLTTLQTLDLSNNQISDISFLEKLTTLQSLDLRNNQISDISFLEKLTTLQSLDLRNNQITTIPFAIFNRFSTYSIEKYSNASLKLYNNPLKEPAEEILKQGRASVLKWYQANKKELKEIKIILVGKGKVGKTSLLKRLKDNDFSKAEVQTDGINIESIDFEKSDTFAQQRTLHGLTGHFWDFGGQEIMSATHQFFLTNRSVYILVLDAREDNKIATQVRNWMQQIQATGGESPVIVVANKLDLNTGFGFSNEYELKQEFSQIKAFLTISCEENIDIDKLKDSLETIIPQAELFNTPIDERWIDIKDQLQKETKAESYLDEDSFRKICEDYGIHDLNEQGNLIQFLHDLGLLLHFEGIYSSEYFVLDPYWITYGVYQIVTSKYVGEQKGRVSMGKLDYIINKEKDKKKVYKPKIYKKIKYKRLQRFFLVDILHQFKLCFYVENKTYFIIPNLLETEEPKATTKAIREANKAIRFTYQYDYLPQAIMPYIMVEAYSITTKRWRTGCLLANSDCKALISSYDKLLIITVVSDSDKPKLKREFMSIVRYLIQKINKKIDLQPKRLIPQPSHPLETKYAIDYDRLLDDEADGDKDYKVLEPVKHRFLISELLDGISNLSLSREDELERQLQQALEKIDKLLEGQQKTHNDIKITSDKIDDVKELLTYVSTHKTCVDYPNVFTLNEKTYTMTGGSGLSTNYRLELYCFHKENDKHHRAKKYYDFPIPDEWVRNVKSVVSKTATVTKYLAPLFPPLAYFNLGHEAFKDEKHKIKAIQDYISKIDIKDDIAINEAFKEVTIADEGEMQPIQLLLKHLDPKDSWRKHLKNVEHKNQIVWVCNKCRNAHY